MIKTKPPDYKFCPFCGKPLQTKKEEGALRKYCPFDNWIYYPHAHSASNAIILKNSKVLLVKRNREPHKGKWMFPAGFLDYGEHPKEAAIRETEEETGLKAKEAEFFDILQTKDDPRSSGTLSFYYLVSVEGDIKNKDTAENSDISWFDLSKLPPIAWEDHEAILKDLVKNERINKRGEMQ